MPKRLSKRKPRESDDPNVAAFRLVEWITGETPQKPRRNVVPIKRIKNPAAVALGRQGGLKSAIARKEKIAPDERRRIAIHAARQRWARKDEGGG